MAKVAGLVDKVVTKTTQTGKTFWTVLVNGQLYSLWQSPNFAVGDTIEFDEIIKGNFKNMANPVKVVGGSGIRQGTPSITASRPNGSFDTDRESRIVRQNATSSAVALVGISKVAGKSDVETLLAVVKDTAKRIFEMNMYGYDAGDTSVPPTTNQGYAKPLGAESVDALLKQF